MSTTGIAGSPPLHYNQSGGRSVALKNGGACEECGALTDRRYRVVHPETGQFIWACTVCEFLLMQKRRRQPNGSW